jgi:transposase-like protein
MDARQALQFRDEAEAYRYVERYFWPDGPECPRCGSCARVGKMTGASTRVGTYKCYSCRKPFTVKIGTLFESSHVPMHKWLRAIYLLSSGRRRVAPNDLHRILEVSPKTAVFMEQRIARACNPRAMDNREGDNAYERTVWPTEADTADSGRAAV